MKTAFVLASALVAAACGCVSVRAEEADRRAEVLARVAAYARCREELALAGHRGRREELRGRLERMGRELAADGIDAASFIGVRGRSEDIFGDWFFDGAWIVNSVYWNLGRKFSPERFFRKVAGRPRESDGVTGAGGVPDSAFFINTDIAAVTPARLLADDERIRPHGNITITRRKREGKSKGFYGMDERGEEYIFIVDPPGMEEQVTAAEVVGSTLVRMAGYNVPMSAIVTIRGTGNPKFDGRRAVATILVRGYRGHWSYRAFRNRREIRATRIFGAWLHNTDWVDHNTGVSVVKVDGFPLTRYYIFDFGGSLGSWNIRPKDPRDGWENYVDFSEIFAWPVRGPLRMLGRRPRPYDEEALPYSEAVGLFDANVDPDRYRANYPNMAWRAMTREDALWAAGLIARYSPGQVRTAVELARYARREDADHVFRTLMERRRRILDHYGAADACAAAPDPGEAAGALE
ncbi:MAG: hypothetical protein PHN82_07160 [bacterium]|nr:hypothetical protein [bacterium]